MDARPRREVAPVRRLTGVRYRRRPRLLRAAEILLTLLAYGIAMGSLVALVMYLYP